MRNSQRFNFVEGFVHNLLLKSALKHKTLYDKPTAADGIESLVVMQRRSAAAEQERSAA